ncbi:MAG TPA: DUF937 domain-containing protein [Hyphomicrobiaceae bacterium]|nr:DUF937 domain-containing protein [Hyphomicrobiaceae bacterium]
MDVVELIETINGGAVVAALGEANGVPAETARDVIRASVPALAFEIERNTLSRGGLADFVSALGCGHHEAYLNASASEFASPVVAADGVAILRHVLGSEEAAGWFARRIARRSGISSSVVESMLPQIAGLTMAGVVHAAGPQLDRMAGMLSRRPGDGERASRAWSEAAASPPRGGNAEIPRQEALPIPGESDKGTSRGGWQPGDERGRSPFDDLSDVIRRRGPAPSEGRPYGGGNSRSVVRDILGQVLGFQRGGVVSWILRFVLFRVAWPILKSILLRGVTGRR